jgi:hypothetical protein
MVLFAVLPARDEKNRKYYTVAFVLTVVLPVLYSVPSRKYPVRYVVSPFKPGALLNYYYP